MQLSRLLQSHLLRIPQLEGEKKTQAAEEKDEVAVEGKGKETVTQGESSFSHALEEGEIDETVCSRVRRKGIHCRRVHR